MKKPLVSIITVNYDTPKVTAEMLATLKTQNYDNFEIIVVDNASPKFTSKHLKKRFSIYYTHFFSQESWFCRRE